MESSARRAGINIEAEPAFRKISDDAIGDLCSRLATAL